jgi:rhodanese-related sulfurtransferase
MDQLTTFINQHWILSSIFVVLLLAVIVNEVFIAMSDSSHVSPAEALTLMNHQDAMVVDIRNANAFSEGHILGSTNIPLDSFEKKSASLEKHKDRNIIIVCATGQSSQKIVATLKQKGFKVLGLSGGVQAWRSASLPLSKH